MAQNPAQLTLRVKSVAWETGQVNVYELRAPDGGELPPFTAGAHITLHLPVGLQRSYSLMNPPHERHRYVLGIARDRASRGGSRYIHEQLRAGDLVQADVPRNQFALAEDAPHSVLIGGGIGVTPMLSMASRLEQLGTPWTLHYAVRSHGEAAFAETLSMLGGGVLMHGDQEAGRLLDIAAIVRSAPTGAHLYCCGPQPMIKTFEAACAGLPPERIHVEHFSATQEAASGGFVVELARSGKVIAVATGSSILQALGDAGMDVPSSCLQGVCGACETAVLAGVPDHRDAVLSPAERAANNTMMLCCSGCKGERLILDL